MKPKLLILFFLFLTQINYAQTGRFVHGKVVDKQDPINGVLVININTKITAITDDNGRFIITANPKDILVFVSKNYESKKVFLDQNSIGNIGFTIPLLQKKVQLKEVLITSEIEPQFESQKIFDIQYFDDAQSSPKNRLVYNGIIENGTDFVRVYKEVSKRTNK